jgi:hypothetical protein
VAAKTLNAASSSRLESQERSARAALFVERMAIVCGQAA